jgi:GMP synthase-like glutamine amidotransferase
MKPRVVVFQHVDFCPLAMVGDGLAKDLIDPTIVRLDKGEAVPVLTDFDIMIVLGGPMDVWQEKENPWLVPEKTAIREWVEDGDKPFLGICLGHQLLADALGGKVALAKKPEVGVLDIKIEQQHPLLDGFGTSKRAIQWHGAEVTRVPPAAKILASTPGCPIAAFQAGSSAFGIQYHVEATDELAYAWGATPGGQTMLELANGAGSRGRVLREVEDAMPELRANATRFYNNFMAVAQERLRH